MFAKQVPARQWKEYQCEIAEYEQDSVPRISEGQSSAAKQFQGHGAEEERIDDVRGSV